MKKVLIFLAIGLILLSFSPSALAADEGFGVKLPNPLCLNDGKQVTTCDPSCDGDAYKTILCTATAFCTSVTACCNKIGKPPVQTDTSCVKDFPTLLSTITKYVTGLIATISVLIFIYAGFLYLTSAGDPAKISHANKAVIYAFIGIAISLAGTGLVAVITAVIGAG
ncbi:pilin [Candidatus Parcubacteria bacterium]|nr:pilin [Candidatus Parcubacteria bacterium]